MEEAIPSGYRAWRQNSSNVKESGPQIYRLRNDFTLSTDTLEMPDQGIKNMTRNGQILSTTIYYEVKVYKTGQQIGAMLCTAVSLTGTLPRL